MREYFSGKACLLSAMAALVLAACGGAESNFMRPDTGAATTPPPVTPPPVDPPPPAGDGTPQAQAGAGFAAAFNQGPFDEPVDPMDGDIIALDKTADPFDIPNP